VAHESNHVDERKDDLEEIAPSCVLLHPGRRTSAGRAGGWGPGAAPILKINEISIHGGVRWIWHAL